jgi:DNA replicative helicase MCM subunit Mcm2 (Cdc46/Mcm family)
MEEGEFTINKYGINARIRSPTVIIASANPVKSSWDDNNNNNDDGDKIDLDQIPAIKPLVDRFDLMFVFRTPRDRDVIRTYADKKSDLDDKLIPDYYNYLKKHIIYARQFNPRLSEEAKSMLTEYWANLAENFGSPRILETLFRLAKARSRLKLKQMVDADDAIETMQFYNVMLQQHRQAVKIPKNPRDVTYNECISILKESKLHCH